MSHILPTMTRNNVKMMSPIVLKINYCAAQMLLRPFEPVGINTGASSVNYRVYYIDGVVITTGYKPIGKTVNFELLKKYENKAFEMIKNHVSENKRIELFKEWLNKEVNA